MDKWATLAGRMLLAGIFIWSGWGTRSGLPELAKYLGSLGLPFPSLLAPLVILWELGGGLALLLGLYTRASALLLGAFCLVTALLVHYHPQNMEAMINFAKNLALTGGFLFVAAHGGGALSLDYRFKLKWS
ncbi:MAG TPA: DoxX family protein [Gammaproteobacteria bacterium]|nr:DoxX family protein [Gammaproteobacteria bacterium]